MNSILFIQSSDGVGCFRMGGQMKHRRSVVYIYILGAPTRKAPLTNLEAPLAKLIILAPISTITEDCEDFNDYRRLEDCVK